jgi:drug/metabolite transporter (DMT)-like permease
MATAIMSFVKAAVLLASVFAPFLVLLGAYFLLPSGIYIGKSPDALDWMWLILLAGMMLGVYFLTVAVAMGRKNLTH